MLINYLVCLFFLLVGEDSNYEGVMLVKIGLNASFNPCFVLQFILDTSIAFHQFYSYFCL